MSKDWYQDIVDFHKEVMLDNFTTHPHLPDQRLKNLRARLIEEEVGETLRAMTEGNLVGIADGIADSIVVLLGTAVTYGIDMRPIWNAVHETNMAKKGGSIRPDGKKLKPEGWTHPDIERLIKEQQNGRH